MEENGVDNVFLTHNNFEVINDQIWYLDSKCSNHITDNKNLFTHFEDNAYKKFWFGDNNQVDIIGKATISFK